MNRRSFLGMLAAVVAAPVTLFKARADFHVSPPIKGSDVWNLVEDGPLVIEGSGEWTITPLGERLDCVIEMWGPGSKAGDAA